MPVTFPLSDGAVQVIQYTQGTRNVVAVGFGERSTSTDRWFRHTVTAPVMMPTSGAFTNFEPLAGQGTPVWPLSTWLSRSDPSRYHTLAQCTQSAMQHATGWLRHESLGRFDYIKTRCAVLNGLPTATAIAQAVLQPFDADGVAPPGGSSQLDPQFYKLLRIDGNGDVQDPTPMGHVFVPASDIPGGPQGITQSPHALEIWFIKDQVAFPAPPAGLGFRIARETVPGLNGDSSLADILTYLASTNHYAGANVVTAMVSCTTYFNRRPPAP